MKKSILKTVVTTSIIALFTATAAFADPLPSNDTENARICLSTKADDNLDDPDKLYFAWFYQNVKDDGTIEEVALTENTDEADEDNLHTAYIKAVVVDDVATSSVNVSYEKYGNGIYIAKCRDSHGNISTEKIELSAWDTDGPAEIASQITPGNDTPSSHKTIKILARKVAGEEETVSDLADKPYAAYGPVDDDFYTSAIAPIKDNDSDLSNFIESHKTDEKMFYWTDSTITVDKSGLYVLFAKDKAGNIAVGTQKAEKIDVTAPVVEKIQFTTEDKDGNSADYDGSTYISENAPLVFKATAVVSDNNTPADKLKYTWYKDDIKIAEGIGCQYISFYPDSKESVSALITPEVVESLPTEGTVFEASDSGVRNADGVYKVVVEDDCGNSSSSDTYPVTIFDFTDPTMSNPVSDTSEAVKSNTIRVSNLSDNIGLAPEPLSYHKVGETGTRTADRSFIVTDNGSYVVDLYDKAGNKYTSPVITISNIDNSSPVINSYVLSNNNKKVRITVDASDTNLAGSDTSSRLQYCLAESSSELASSTNWQESNILDDYDGADIESRIYWIGVKDRAGNMSTQFISVNKDYVCGDLSTMDEESLTSYITQSPEASVWTNGNVELTVNIPSIIEDPQFKFNSGEYQSSNKKSFAGNGNVVVTVKDKYGNEYSSVAYTIGNIDKVVPAISAALNDNANKATIEVTDEASKLHKVTVIIDDEEEKTIQDYSGTETVTDTVTYSIPKKGNYVFKVYDKAGNVSATETISVSTSKVDNTELTKDGLTAKILITPDSWTNGTVKLKLALDSTVGLDPAPFKWSTQDDFGTNNELIVSEVGSYSVAVKDAYGNVIESDAVLVDKIDKVSPSITANSNSNSNKILISATDTLSKMDKITVVGGPITEEQTIKDSVGLADPETIAVNWSVPASNKVYTIRAYDKAGNYEDKTVVIGTATTDNDNLTESNLKSFITQTPVEWTNGTVTLTLALSNTTDLDANPYSWDGGETWSTTRTLTVSENGQYSVRVKDAYGNVITSKPYTVSNIDTVDPTISAETNDNGNKVTVHVADTDSKVRKVTVIAPEAEEETIRDYSASPVLEDNVDYVVPQNGDYTFKVYDMAGNVASVDSSISGAITDNAELSDDVITARIIKTPGTWTNGEVTLKLALNSTAGLAENPYKWTGQDDFGTDNTLVVEENGTYSVTVKDSFGNEFTGSVEVDKIDKVLPEIHYSSNTNGNTLSISATDELSKVQKITIEGGTYETETTIKDNGGLLTKAALVADWPIPLSNTTYTVRAYDNAGNVFEQNIEVGLAYTDNEDLTPANIFAHITHTPTGWTNSPVTLTLALSNTADLDETPYSWNNGETYSKSRTAIVRENGEYKVWVKDHFGNVIKSNAYAVKNIDTDAPSLTFDYKDENNNTLVFTMTDTEGKGVSGINRLMICEETDSGVNETLIYDELADNVTNQTAEWVIPQNGTYTFRLYDNAGNYCDLTETFNGAKSSNTELTPETIASRITVSPNTATKDTVRLQLVLNDTSGLAEKPFKWGVVTEYRHELLAPTIDPETGEETFTAIGGDEVSYLSDDFTDVNYVDVSANGPYFVVIKDKYGHETKSDSVTVAQIDTRAPGVPMGMGYEYPKVSEDGTITISLTDSEYHGSISPGYTGYGSNGTSGIAKVTVTGGALTEETVVKDYPNHPADATVTYRAPALGEYVFHVYDAVGNVNDIPVTVENAVTDNAEINDPAVLTSKIKSNAEGVEWTAGPVTLSVGLSSFEGLAPAPFKWSGQTEFSNNNSFDVTENGNYRVIVKDIYGNENESLDFAVSNIDSVKPQITLSKSEDGTKLIYSASDSQSGITRIEWASGSTSEIMPIGAWASPQSSIEGVVPFPNNGVYTVSVYDRCGNVDSESISVENISAPNPLLDASDPAKITASVRKSPTEWTNGNVVVSIDMLNKTGVNPNGYIWETDAQVTEETQKYIGTAGDRTSIEVMQNGTAYVTVTDDYGTKFKSEGVVIDNIDKNKPSVEAFLNDKGDMIHVRATDDLSGISRLCYQIDGGEEYVICLITSHVIEAERDVKLSKKGTYTITAYDSANNAISTDVTVSTVASDILSDHYINNNITFSNDGYTNGNVDIVVDIPNRELLDPAPYSWDGGETWTNNNRYTATDNGTYEVLVKDLSGNVYTGTAIVSNIDRVDPTLNLEQKGDSLQVTAGDNIYISKITMNDPDSPYEVILQEYADKKIFDTLSVPLTKNGTYTVNVFDSAGNKISRDIEISGITEQSNNAGGNQGESGTTPPVTNPSNNNNNSDNSNNSGNSGSSGTVVKEYHYDTKEKQGVVVSERPVSSGSSTPSRSVSQPVYSAPTTVSQPVVQTPAIKVNPTPAVASNNVSAVTPTPTPTPSVKSAGTTATSSTVSTTAKKVTPSTSSTVSKTSTVSAVTPVETKEPETSSEPDVDAKAMYRNNRVEQVTEQEPNKKNPKVGLIIFGSVLGVALIGAGIYAFTKRKEQKKFTE